MSVGLAQDVSACRHWRKSMMLGETRIGLVPGWNAVVGLNPAAADIWDLLIETGDAAQTALAYGARRPDRRAEAEADVAACLALWAEQGLLRPPAPRTPLSEPETATRPPAFRRCLVVGETPLRLEVEDAHLGAAIGDLTADFPDAPETPAMSSLRASGPGGGWRVARDGRVVRRADDPVALRGDIVGELVGIAGGDAGWQAILHGAVLARNGTAILLAGPSGAGKSTLSAGLLSRGWRLLAEDCAALDGALRVHPIPFCLSIKSGAFDVLRGSFPDLGAARLHRLGRREVRYQPLPAERRATAPMRPGLLLDIRYDPALAPDQAETRRLAPVEALGLFLNDESFIDFERDAEAFLRFVEATPAYALRQGGLDGAERAIAALLSGQGPKPE